MAHPILNQLSSLVSGNKPETRPASSSRNTDEKGGFSRLLNQALDQTKQAPASRKPGQDPAQQAPQPASPNVPPKAALNASPNASKDVSPDTPAEAPAKDASTPGEPAALKPGELPMPQILPTMAETMDAMTDVPATQPAPAEGDKAVAQEAVPEENPSGKTAPVASEPVSNPSGKPLPDQARATFEAVQKLQNDPDKPKTLPEQAKAFLSQMAQGPQRALEQVRAALQPVEQMASGESPAIPGDPAGAVSSEPEILLAEVPADAEASMDVIEAAQPQPETATISELPQEAPVQTTDASIPQPSAHAVAAALGSEHARLLPEQASDRAQEATATVGNRSVAPELPAQAPQAHGQTGQQPAPDHQLNTAPNTAAHSKAADANDTAEQPAPTFQQTLADASKPARNPMQNQITQAVPQAAPVNAEFPAAPGQEPEQGAEALFTVAAAKPAEETAPLSASRATAPQTASDVPLQKLAQSLPEGGEGAKVEIRTDAATPASVHPTMQPAAAKPFASQPAAEETASDTSFDIAAMTVAQSGNNESVPQTEAAASITGSAPAKAADVKGTNLQNALFQSPAADIGDQVVEGVSHAYRGGQRELTIQLNPHNLGEVRVHIVSRGEQGVTARLIASGAESHDALQSQIGQLKSSLEAQGIQVERLSVVMAGRGEGAEMGGGQQQSQTSNGQGNAFSQQRQDSGQQSGNPQQQAFQEALAHQHGQHNGQGSRHSGYAQRPDHGMQPAHPEGQAAGRETVTSPRGHTGHDNGSISILA